MAAELLSLLMRVSLAASAAILMVLALRGLVRGGLGARVAYGLWAAVPLAAAAVLIPARRLSAVSTHPVSTPNTSTVSDLVSIDTPAVWRAPASVVDLSGWAMLAWAAGAIACLAILAIRHRRFLSSLGSLTPAESAVSRASSAGIGPALVGFFRPTVIVPADFEARFAPEERRLVLVHERQHLAAGDTRINAVVAVAQCLIWFNPLVHIAAFYFRIDQELACDAAVITRHPDQRQTYAQAMLKTQIAPQRLAFGCYWPAQALAPLKQRIAMLSVSQPGRARRLTGAAAVVALSGGLACAAWAAQPPRPPAPGETRTTEVSPLARHRGAALLDLLIETRDQADIAAVRALVEAGADVNYRRLGDGAPLIIATRSGQTEVVRFLLDHGADANIQVHADGAPLIAAAFADAPAAAQLLVDHGADVNIDVPSDETPLITAARLGHLSMVTFLVEHGAQVNRSAMTERGIRRTPVGEARRGGFTDIEAYLRAHGATG